MELNMVTTEFIAAIELSSSKISGIAGHRNADGSMQILAYASEPSVAFVRKGVVYNIGKAAGGLTSVINKLEEQLKCTIAKVYVGIGGQSVRTVENKISRTADTEIIPQGLIDSLNDENLTYPIVNMDILDVVPQEYEIDNHLYTDPVGVTGHFVTGKFLNIVASPSLKKNLEMSFEQARIRIADFLTAPLYVGRAVLTDNELRAGCALVDLGADTTTVAVYKNNLLRYLCVLPLGGANITRDLTSMQIEEDEAEQLKRQFGDALYQEEETTENLSPAACRTADGRSIPLSELNDIVGARVEEILANVWNQIKLSGYEDKLLAGIVLTGGGSNLRHIDAALLKLSKLKKIRTATFVQDTVRGHQEEIPKDGTQTTLFALLLAGTDNCCQPEEPKIPHIEPGKPVDMFQDDENLKAQEEENRRKKEEEDRRRKEEENRRKDEEKKKKKDNKPSWLKRKMGMLTDELFGDNDSAMK